MTRLTVAQVKDLSNQGGMSFSNGTITANGTLNVTNIVINGNVSGSSGYIVPSQSGQSGSFLSTNDHRSSGLETQQTKVFQMEFQYIMVTLHGINPAE